MIDHEKFRKENFSLYNDYNKALRAWFVAFGVGLPVVYISSKEARDYLGSLVSHELVIIFFVLAMCLQIIIAFVNKYVSWCAYRTEGNLVSNLSTSKFVLWVKSWENAIWLDVLVDVLSLVFFGISIFILLFGE